VGQILCHFTSSEGWLCLKDVFLGPSCTVSSMRRSLTGCGLWSPVTNLLCVMSTLWTNPILFFVLVLFILSCPFCPFLSLSFFVLSCPFLSFLVLSCPLLSFVVLILLSFLSFFLSFFVLLCPFLSFYVLFCPFMSFLSFLVLVLLCPFCPFMSFYVLFCFFCPFMSFLVLSCPFLSCPFPESMCRRKNWDMSSPRW
jgi:hypothetical protein